MGGYNTEGAKLVDSVLDIVRNSGIPANTRSVVEPDQEWGTLLISNVPQKYPDRIKNIDQKKSPNLPCKEPPGPLSWKGWSILLGPLLRNGKNGRLYIYVLSIIVTCTVYIYNYIHTWSAI